MSGIQVEVPNERIKAFCQKWKVRELALFGSVVRDDFRPDSDVDVLVAFADDAKWGLWEMMEAGQELERILGRKVDFVENKCVTNPFRRHAILGSKHVIYAARS